MAERRMFSKKIINSARFLKMPATSRLLYYDLGMAAYDDGIVEAFTVLQTTGASIDDLEVLASKQFIIILNQDLVTYIKDWNIHNLIRKDRYHPSNYTDLFVKIVTESGTQILSESSSILPQDEIVQLPDCGSGADHWLTTGQPDDNQWLTEVSSDKDRLDQNNIHTNGTDYSLSKQEKDFEQFWQAYPKKAGKLEARKEFSRVSVPVSELINAVQLQSSSSQWKKNDGQYIPNPARWLSEGRWEDVICNATVDCPAATSSYVPQNIIPEY